MFSAVTPSFSATVLWYTGHLLPFMSSVWKAWLEPSTLHDWSPLKHVARNHPHDPPSTKGSIMIHVLHVVQQVHSNLPLNDTTHRSHGWVYPRCIHGDAHAWSLRRHPMHCHSCGWVEIGWLRETSQKTATRIKRLMRWWLIAAWKLETQIKEQKEHIQIGVTIVDAKISNLKSLSSTMTRISEAQDLNQWFSNKISLSSYSTSNSPLFSVTCSRPHRATSLKRDRSCQRVMNQVELRNP